MSTPFEIVLAHARRCRRNNAGTAQPTVLCVVCAELAVIAGVKEKASGPYHPTMEDIDFERTRANALLEISRSWAEMGEWAAIHKLTVREAYEKQCDKVLVMLYDYRGEKHT